MTTAPDHRTRRVRNLVEPVAGVAFFAPEVHARYARLGFADPGGEVAGVRQLDWPAYFASRAAPMGRVAGASAAAVFGVFPTPRVADAVDGAWTITTPQALLDARTEGTVLALERLLGTGLLRAEAGELAEATAQLDRGLAAVPVAGRPLFAALRSLPAPDHPLGRWWSACTQFREHRMDAHVAAFAQAGLDGCQACLLNDLRQGLGLGSYVRTRGWTEAEVAIAADGLRSRGLIDDGLTDGGRELREEVEAATDAAQTAIIEAMGDLDRFVAIVDPWRQQIIDGFGYPGRRMVEQVSRRAGR
jgi:hypothetical protein